MLVIVETSFSWFIHPGSMISALGISFFLLEAETVHDVCLEPLFFVVVLHLEFWLYSEFPDLFLKLQLF